MARLIQQQNSEIFSNPRPSAVPGEGERTSGRDAGEGASMQNMSPEQRLAHLRRRQADRDAGVTYPIKRNPALDAWLTREAERRLAEQANTQQEHAEEVSI